MGSNTGPHPHPLNEITFDRHDDLPYDTHCHLLDLEVWIGNLDGMTACIPTDGNTFLDEGTIDAADAVKAVNALIYAMRHLMAQRDGEREARHKSDAALQSKDRAMTVLFDRLRAHGDKCEDLIP